MDFQRLLLSLIFALSLFLLWEGWQRQQHPPLPVPVTAVPESASAPATAAPPTQTASATSASASASASVPQGQEQSGQKITVKTDWLTAEISTAGGDLYHLDFLRQYDAHDRSKPYTLLDRSDTHYYVAQTGLLGNGLPTHNALFTSPQSEYQLTDDQKTLEVRLTAVETGVVKVTKIYTFHRSSYVIDVSYEIENTGTEPLPALAYFQLVRDTLQPDSESKFMPTYTGPAVYTDEKKFQKIKFADIEKGKADFPHKANNGWISMLQHYFVAAWFLNDQTEREFYMESLDKGRFRAGMKVPVATVAPGKTVKVGVSLYAGPSESSLNQVAPGLGLTVDYGWLTILSTPLFWVLSKLQGWVHNWGIAIILLTVLIKLIFFPLSAASYRSMAKMRVVAPKLEKIKQQYGEDRERLHKAMMELYRTEKINPLGGCLPMLIQIPVFIALYWAILSSVELRYAPFFGWIHDLSAPDPFYILPLIMGTSMIIQSRLSPAPPDPMQAKVMRTMPVVFSIVFFFFPAGLVLYSIVNNVLSIAQQWVITRRLEAGKKGAAKA